MTTDWKARAAEVRDADDDDWERLSEAYDDDWKAAYCAEFRRYAAERVWSQENIDSGWLDDLPGDAVVAYDRGADPVACARLDVPQCEQDAADAEAYAEVISGQPSSRA